ncbi:hypothetical protein DM02DRAFT_484863, partial [Periconia macrospinosa]
ATTSQAPPSALTFPRPIFAAVSPHPFLQAHLSASQTRQRANGRSAQEFRAPLVNTGSLTHCHGSAVVRLGNTSVVCGIRGEILKEEDAQGYTYTPTTTSSNANDDNDEDDDGDLEEETHEISTLRLLVPNVELSTGSTPNHIPSNAPSSVAQTLITRLRSLLLSTSLIRARDLRILYTPPLSSDATPAAEQDDPPAELKAYWTLYMDVFFISIDGNAFDAAWLGILAALQNTRLPRAEWDPEYETILCDDDPAAARALRLRGLPVPASFAVFEAPPPCGGEWDESGEEEGGDGDHWVLCDPDAFEESVCREGVCVVVDCGKGKKAGPGDMVVRRVEKSGGGVVGREEMRGLVKRAVERWEVVRKVLG